MDLEERSLEPLDDHCQECGTKLTEDEMRLALEAGGPPLCKIHAYELTSLETEDPAEAEL